MPATNLGKINLLPKDAFEFSALGKIMKWALTTGRVLVVLTEFVVILAFGSRFYFDKQLNDLIDTVGQKQAIVASYVEIEAKIRDLLTRQTIVDKYLSTNLGLTNVVSQIKTATPADVTYDEISIASTGLSLSGTAGSEGGLANLLVGLNNLPKVTSVNVGSIDFDQRLGVINFKLTVTTGKT